MGRVVNGIFINPPGSVVKISIRNADHCSVFRLELIAVSGALDHTLIKRQHLDPDRQLEFHSIFEVRA
ncbi:hypothetical protein TNCV_289331 [Trichonephila clavipes]|nr:hypothetical protein TNCV_289331 [Trichonephila clavipes]